MIFARSIICVILLFLCASGSAFAEKRVALVIGNSAYKNVAALPNPARDAQSVATALERLGFQVTFASNQTKSQLDNTLKDFGDTVRDADWAIIYFAGHGIAVEGETYILPVDATLAYADHVEDEAIGLSRLRSKLSRAKTLRMVVLDSCRNNPFLTSMKADGQKRSVSRGLARPSEPAGDELVVYATRENSTADDGDSEHSPFTVAFLANVEQPGIEVGYLFRKIRSDVLDATSQRQSPAIYGELSARQLYFKALGSDQIASIKQPENATAQQSTRSAAASEWSGVDRNSISELQTFISHYPSSPEADYARAKLAELQKKQEASLEKKKTDVPVLERKTGELSLTDFEGTWKGVYAYSTGNRVPVNFTMYLTIDDTTCRGRIEEPNTFGNNSSSMLYAGVTCKLDTRSSPPRFTFEKAYDGTGGVGHGVLYTGVISKDKDGIAVAGSWMIGNIAGRFAMKR